MTAHLLPAFLSCFKSEFVSVRIEAATVRICHQVLDLRPVYTCNFRCDFQCDFRLLTDVKERINNECSEYMFLHLNIRVCLLVHIHQTEKIAL